MKKYIFFGESLQDVLDVLHLGDKVMNLDQFLERNAEYIADAGRAQQQIALQQGLDEEEALDEADDARDAAENDLEVKWREAVLFVVENLLEKVHMKLTVDKHGIFYISAEVSNEDSASMFFPIYTGLSGKDYNTLEEWYEAGAHGADREETWGDCLALNLHYLSDYYKLYKTSSPQEVFSNHFKP